jgi:hypothetical protein
LFNTYNDNDNINLLQQNIDNSITFLEYINTHFEFNQYIIILLQIALTLEIAQTKCGFVHNDLTPWNIILQKYQQPVTIQYHLSYNKTYTIKSNIVAVVIDYEKSHVIYRGFHYGKINMFSTSTIQDILSLISTSIYEVVQLPNVDADKVYKLVNFISGTDYHPAKFVKKPNDNFGEIKYFFGKTKKFSELISCKKYQLEEYTPINFVEYIIKHLPPCKNNFYSCSTYIEKPKNNVKQMFDFYTSNNVQEKIKSFTDFFDRIILYKDIDSKNLFLSYYIIQKLTESCDTVFEDMKKFVLYYLVVRHQRLHLKLNVQSVQNYYTLSFKINTGFL